MKKILPLVLSLFLGVAALQAHSDAFKPEFVDTLVAPYLAIQKGLASDDLKSAQAGAQAFLAAMQQAPHAGEAKEEAEDLSAPVEAIAAATDLKAARSAFRNLSNGMISLIQHVGTTQEMALYSTHCPMAFAGKGGDWVQSDKTVSNPYYGSMMLHCGSIEKRIDSKQDEASETEESAAAATANE